MPETINGVNVPFIPIVNNDEFVNKQARVKGNSFENVFQRELEKIKFSAHANKRLESRNIEMSEVEMIKLQEGIDKAEAKGSRDALIMVDNTAFIVNIPNKTVVTAMPVEESAENIFTNIDSVVFTF